MASDGTNSINGGEHGDAPDTPSPWVIPLQINGQELKTGTTFDVVNPSTGKVIWKASAASKEDAIRAVEAAQAAFPAWSGVKPSKRRDILLRAAEIMTTRIEELGDYMMTETGAGPAARDFNVFTGIELLKDVAGRIITITGSVPVCGIAPWNAPYILGIRAVAYALAAGNTTVLKAPELSPRCYWAIGSVLKEAGLPDGCLNIIAHRSQDAAEVTNPLIEHPYVKKVNFTGSTIVGSIIAAVAGKNLKPCLMELGGKASAIVLPDADLEKAAEACAEGAFFHSGQVCMSTERIIVHRDIASAFSEKMKDAIKKSYGSDKAPPILVAAAGVVRNHKLISQAVEKGAKVVTGDINAKESSDTRMRPIVVEGVTKEMDLYHQESFGPSVSLMVVDSEEKAIELANDTDYGLSAAVFTKSLARGLKVAKQIESGAVHINSMTIHDEPNLPHGGSKKSGFGRFNGSAGLEEFLQSKTVTWQD